MHEVHGVAPPSERADGRPSEEPAARAVREHGERKGVHERRPELGVPVDVEVPAERERQVGEDPGEGIVSESLEQRPLGGLGVFLVRQLTESSYERRGDVNHVRLRRILGGTRRATTF